MASYFFWTFALAVLAVLSVGAALFVRAYLTGTSPSAFLFRPKGDRRLEVVDHANVDSRRKLVLIRRDNVEHLLLTGGPVDVVIETGINAAAVRPVPATAAQSEVPPPIRRAPVFSRPAEPAPLMGTPER
ncbi:MAG: flagellar biosynthetic protein FliO [Proteobacteria bacterium]|nr:flagellar biosynthetic protein FliO [Pseudomonadota bacterium]